MRKVPRHHDGTGELDAVLLDVADVLALDRTDAAAQQTRRRVRAYTRLHGHRRGHVHVLRLARVRRGRPRGRSTRCRTRRAASRGSTRAGPGGDPPGSPERTHAAAAGVRT